MSNEDAVDELVPYAEGAAANHPLRCRHGLRERPEAHLRARSRSADSAETFAFQRSANARIRRSGRTQETIRNTYMSSTWVTEPAHATLLTLVVPGAEAGSHTVSAADAASSSAGQVRCIAPCPRIIGCGQERRPSILEKLTSTEGSHQGSHQGSQPAEDALASVRTHIAIPPS